MNATALHRKVGSDVAVTSITRRPRAIVVILGEKIDHYTELYHSLQCSTISVEHAVGEWALTVSRETARLVRVAQLSEMGMGHVPVMIHIMGSGGRGLVKELERQVRLVLDADDIPTGLPPPRSSTKTLNMNASTRSLFTNDTEPMSSDDEDDESSLHEESSIIETPLATRPMLKRQSPQQQVRRRPRSLPSVHRIDMERTAVSLQYSLNPEGRAYRRDLEQFCSHLSLTLWDMPPPPASGWSIRDLLTRIILFFAFMWNVIKQRLFGSMARQQQEVAGLSLARQHALMYIDDKDESVKCLLQEANVVMQTRLHGTRKQHGAEYVAFVQQALDRISSHPMETGEDEGWSSDED